MAANVVVFDSGFLRTTVKVNPGTFLVDVLQEVCDKKKLDSSNYGLKHNGKPIELSRTYRQTGLTHGAKLELVAASRTPTAVSIALQLPQALAIVAAIPNGRMTGTFASDITFWKVLRHFEEKHSNMNLTARAVTETSNGASGAGRLYYEMPALHVMGRVLSTFEDLQKTLRQLGISGNCLIRLEPTKTTQPLEEAMKDIEAYFKEADAPVSAGKNTTEVPQQEESTASESLAQVQANQQPEESTVNVPSTNASEPSTTTIGDVEHRPISVFAPPSGDTPQAALRPYNEADYEPTIAHAKLHQSRLLNNTANKRLASDAELERAEQERAAKLATTKSVAIKIRFPDQSVVLSTFNSTESGADLYRFVTKAIVAENQPFKLVWTNKGPQTVPKDEKKLLIKHLGFERQVLVNFLWGDNVNVKIRQQPALKPNLRETAQEIKVPDIAGVEAKADDVSPAPDNGKGKETTAGGGKGKGVPKWFKGIGKK